MSRDTAFTPPASFAALKTAIAESYSRMPRQQQQIARYVLERPEDVALSTIATLAKLLEVPPSSIVRFAQGLRFDGYSMMQCVLRTRLAAQRGSRQSPMKQSQSQKDGNRTCGRLAEIISDEAASLSYLQARVDAQDLRQAAKMLAGARNVYLIGMNNALPIAFYLHYALSNFGRRTRLVVGSGGVMRELVAQAGAEDMMLVISFAPYADVVVDIVEERSRACVPTVVITDSALSPIARDVVISLAVLQRKVGSPARLAAPMCVAQAIAIYLGAILEKTHLTPQPESQI